MTLANKRCMVIGGLGFIGYNIVKALHREHAHVIVVDDLSYGLPERAFPQDNVEILSASNADKLTFFKPDIIFHFGSKSSILHYVREPVETAYDTIAGWRGVLALQKATGARLVAASSATVYGAAPLPQIESGPTYPVNDYSIAKLLCERMSAKQPVALMRPFTGYGSDETAKTWFQSPIGKFIESIQNKKPIEIMGDGKQTRDFIEVSDIVEAALILAQNEHNGPVNIGTGRQTTINDLADMVQTEMGYPVYMKKFIPKFDKYVDHMKADMTLYNQVIDRVPMTIEQGIKKFVEDLNHER